MPFNIFPNPANQAQRILEISKFTQVNAITPANALQPDELAQLKGLIIRDGCLEVGPLTPQYSATGGICRPKYISAINGSPNMASNPAVRSLWYGRNASYNANRQDFEFAIKLTDNLKRGQLFAFFIPTTALPGMDGVPALNAFIECGIYSDNSGSPGSLVDQGSRFPAEIGAITAQWSNDGTTQEPFDFTFESPVFIWRVLYVQSSIDRTGPNWFWFHLRTRRETVGFETEATSRLFLFGSKSLADPICFNGSDAPSASANNYKYKVLAYNTNSGPAFNQPLASVWQNWGLDASGSALGSDDILATEPFHFLVNCSSAAGGATFPSGYVSSPRVFSLQKPSMVQTTPIGPQEAYEFGGQVAYDVDGGTPYLIGPQIQVGNYAVTMIPGIVMGENTGKSLSINDKANYFCDGGLAFLAMPEYLDACIPIFIQTGIATPTIDSEIALMRDLQIVSYGGNLFTNLIDWTGRHIGWSYSLKNLTVFQTSQSYKDVKVYNNVVFYSRTKAAPLTFEWSDPGTITFGGDHVDQLDSPIVAVAEASDALYFFTRKGIFQYRGIPASTATLRQMTKLGILSNRDVIKISNDEILVWSEDGLFLIKDGVLNKIPDNAFMASKKELLNVGNPQRFMIHLKEANMVVGIRPAYACNTDVVDEDATRSLSWVLDLTTGALSGFNFNASSGLITTWPDYPGSILLDNIKYPAIDFLIKGLPWPVTYFDTAGYRGQDSNTVGGQTAQTHFLPISIPFLKTAHLPGGGESEQNEFYRYELELYSLTDGVEQNITYGLDYIVYGDGGDIKVQGSLSFVPQFRGVSHLVIPLNFQDHNCYLTLKFQKIVEGQPQPSEGLIRLTKVRLYYQPTEVNAL